MVDVTSVYQKIGESSLPAVDAPSTTKTATGGKSFADVLLVDPAKKAIDAAQSAENASILSTTGDMDELTVAELINEADVALQEFKTIWEKSVQALNELPRVSM